MGRGGFFINAVINVVHYGSNFSLFDNDVSVFEYFTRDETTGQLHLSGFEQIIIFNFYNKIPPICIY